MQNRNITIDLMKGVGVLLVVWYHCCGWASNIMVTGENGAYNAIETFFMPLFFILSGYLFYGKKWTLDRIKHFIPPLLVFIGIYWLWGNLAFNWFYTPPLSFPDYFVFITTNGWNYTVTWYVWTLVCLYAIFLLFWALRAIPIWLRTVLFVLVISLVPNVTFLGGLNNLIWYGGFFFTGYMIAYSNEKHEFMKRLGKFAYLALGLFPLCLFLFNWMQPYEGFVYASAIHKSFFYGLTNGTLKISFMMLLLAFLGTGFIYSFVRLVIERSRHLTRVFQYFGVASMGIYLFHIMFVGISPNYWVSWVLAVGISLGLYKWLRRYRLASFLLFGKRMKVVIGG